MRDVAQELAGKAALVQINTDLNSGLASSYQIQGIPALLLFKGGQLVGRTSGGMSKQALLGWIEKFL